MALKIDEIMDLSLDDYIAISKKKANTAFGNDDHVKSHHNIVNNDAKFGRRKGNIDDEDEDEEDDFLMQTAKEILEEEKQEKVSSDIWKGPDSSISYLDCNNRRNDLREKLNNNNKRNSNISAVQCRMMAPNNTANRPRGIPTLLPLDVQLNSKNPMNFRGNRRNGGNRGYNNLQRSYNSNNVYNTKIAGGVSNGRVQRNRNQDIEGKNLRFSVGKTKGPNNRTEYSLNQQAQNMIIETPSSCINLAPSPPLNSSFKIPKNTITGCNNTVSQTIPIGGLTPQAEAVLNLNSIDNHNTSLATSSNNESIKSLLGFQGNVSGDMMPIFASRLMEYIQNGLQKPLAHKPVYDMKIQKDIHEIQNKPLLYKCPGGEVISSDGAGVNCKITPRTSGVSLNCRFA